MERLDRKVVEIEWNLEWVKSLESIAYSNSVIHLIPIHTVITPAGTLKYNLPEHRAWAKIVGVAYRR